MDEVVSKMLCLHIPSLLPPTISETTTKEATVQAAAILGVGLLYEGSNHRLMTEFLIEEMGRKPLNDRYADRESYSLSAGLALGLVTLGAGNYPEKRKALADLHLEDRLHRYMVGGSTTDKDNTSGGQKFSAKQAHKGPYGQVLDSWTSIGLPGRICLPGQPLDRTGPGFLGGH